MPRILPSAASVSAIRSSSNFGRPDWARFVIPPGRSRLRIPREYSYISFLMVYIYAIAGKTTGKATVISSTCNVKSCSTGKQPGGLQRVTLARLHNTVLQMPTSWKCKCLHDTSCMGVWEVLTVWRAWQVSVVFLIIKGPGLGVKESLQCSLCICNCCWHRAGQTPGPQTMLRARMDESRAAPPARSSRE